MKIIRVKKVSYKADAKTIKKCDGGIFGVPSNAKRSSPDFTQKAIGNVVVEVWTDKKGQHFWVMGLPGFVHKIGTEMFADQTKAINSGVAAGKAFYNAAMSFAK